MNRDSKICKKRKKGKKEIFFIYQILFLDYFYPFLIFLFILLLQKKKRKKKKKGSGNKFIVPFFASTIDEENMNRNR